jgi:hypothetical protein
VKSSAVILVLALVIGFAAIHMFRTDAATSSQERTSKTAFYDEYSGPIVNYDVDNQAAAVPDPQTLALRQARSRRYNREAPQPLGEFPSNLEGYDITSPWYRGLQTLPVTQSDAVVLGEVLDSKAYLSTDKTGVYSEFTISVKDISKNSDSSPLQVGASIIAEREGGIVRFQDGRLFRFTINHQRMPRVGKQYVFFLTVNQPGQDFVILTGYELRQGKVSPLDIAEQFDKLNGLDKQLFLTTLRDEVVRSSQVRKER